MTWLKQNWRKYLPDSLILLGTFLLARAIFPPSGGLDLVDFETNYHEDEILGIVLIALGADIAIRRLTSKFSK